MDRSCELKNQYLMGKLALATALGVQPEWGQRLPARLLGPPSTEYNDRVDWADVPADQLLRACAKPDSTAAWKEFMRRYHGVLTAAAIRVSRHWGKGTADEIDDIVQDIYIKLCADGARVLTSFQAVKPGEDFGYLKVVATHHAQDYYRKRAANKRGLRNTESLEDSHGVAAPDGGMERRLVLAEVDKVLRSETQTQTGPRDRGIFRLYYQQGMTAKAIAELPGVQLSQKGVESVLQRLTDAIRKTLRPQQESDPR